MAGIDAQLTSVLHIRISKMKYSVLFLLLISSLASARSWQESFDDAAERKSKSDCESTYERMRDQCSLVGIYRGGQNRNAPLECRIEANSLKSACIATVNEKLADEAEEKASAQSAREEQEMAQRNFQAATDVINRAGAPALELACTLMQTTRPTSFNRNIEIKIYNGGACDGSFSRHLCSISTAQFAGSTRSRNWELNRSTGEMSVTLQNDYSITAVYSCQKASAATNKF